MRTTSSAQLVSKFFALLHWLVVLSVTPAMAQDEVSLGGAKIIFASQQEAAEILGTSDLFTEQLSAFDRSARLKTDQPVDQGQYLHFVREQALSWSEEEQKGVIAVLKELEEKLAPLRLNLPAEIRLIKTTGLEEGNAAYTRGAAIILPKQKVAGAQRGLSSLLLHELFHVLSRHDPLLREKLYAIIGFRPCTPLQLPETFEARKLTNPDGPTNDHYIQVQSAGQQIAVMPILYSETGKYDPKRGGEFFSYLTFKLIAIQPPQNGQPTLPLLKDDQIQLLEPKSAEGYIAQIGANTGYIIHPDEVLADNFVLMVTGRKNVATPELLVKIRECFFDQ